MSAISPKNPPAPMRPTSSPSTEAIASPSTATKNSSPSSPSRVTSVPAGDRTRLGHRRDPFDLFLVAAREEPHLTEQLDAMLEIDDVTHRVLWLDPSH